jgi:hypothetical protein
MSKRRKKQGKTFQQRQTERKLRDQQERLERDTVVEDMAAKYSCSTETARDFAHQCGDHLDEFEYYFDCASVALDFWSEAPTAKAKPVVDALRELAAELERHHSVIDDLHGRLIQLANDASVHEHLEQPAEHYQQQLRLRLFPDPDPRPVQNHAASRDY